MNTTAADIIIALPFSAIELGPQVRTENGRDEESLRELSESIKAVGLLNPITVERIGAERFRLIAGERRLLACEIAGMEAVPALVREYTCEQAPLVQAAQLIENVQRVDLSLADRAAGVASLVASTNAKTAANLLGKSPAWISKHLGYAKLPAQVREAATAGDCQDIEILQAVAQYGKKATTPDTIARFNHATQRIENGTMTRADARALLDSLKPPAPPAPRVTNAGAGVDLEPDPEDETEPPRPAKSTERASGTQTLGADAWILIRDALAFALETNPNEKAKNLHALLRDWINNEWGV